MMHLPFAQLTAALAAIVVGLPHAATGSSRCPDCDSGGRPDTLVAQPSSSSIRWKGLKVTGADASEGTVLLARGELVLRHGELTGGSFTIAMNRLQIADPDRTLLRAPFVATNALEVKRFPTATFVATSSKRTSDSTWRVDGNLTLHGVTRPVSFSSNVHWVDVGHMIATADLTLDRRDFGIGTTGPMSTRLVGDEIQLAIRLDARRRSAVVAER